MAGAAVESEFETWNAPERSAKIEYSGAVMDQIRMAAVDGYHCVPHGGVETGGILFGTYRQNLVRILAWRPILCEYAKGPSFVLSEKDEAALADALQSWRSDPTYAGLEPVGWYHSHTRTEISLTDADLELFDRFFPRPWQVALVVRPASFAPTRAGFFFREPDGSVHAQSSYREFALPAGRAGGPAVDSPAHASAAPASLIEREAPLEEIEAEPSPETAAEPLPLEPARRTRWKWYVAGLILIALAGAAALRRFPYSREGFALSATDSGGQLLISWDRKAATIRKALRGSLAIEDRGGQTEVKLTAAELRFGSIAYARQSGDVVVRLTAELPGGVTVDEVTRFLRPAGHSQAPPDAGDLELQRETEAMHARIESQKSELARLEQMVETMHQAGRAAVPPKTSAPLSAAPFAGTKPAPPLKTPDSQVTSPPIAANKLVPPPETAPSPNVAPPKRDKPADAPQTTAAARPPAPAPSAPVSPAPAPATSIAATPSPAAVAPPASGRLIWTGKLLKNGILTIERGRPSTGVLNGSLPAGAAQVSAYPGDLTSEGMTLFTPDTKYAHPQTEAPGAHNGWNRTTYTWDAKRAGAIRIVEQPGPQNGYKLVLRSEAAKVSVLVIDWRVAP